ncbi:uncharacterized protein FPOAC1_012878 [Fusarium poae]|uniref:uncharacterized protein n=1 Tax=Fusarium poae TaxID=36050 RepID=UPI001D047CDD|nr:uncharacterized protein FPOAC1_012878 [Fusarium poae]KAG8664901.1 hypothetical protein FPOAC1_012878 [Fusarium poae]
MVGRPKETSACKAQLAPEALRRDVVPRSAVCGGLKVQTAIARPRRTRDDYEAPTRTIPPTDSNEQTLRWRIRRPKRVSKPKRKSAGTAKRTATNTTRITSRITNDGLQEGKNDTDSGAAMLQKVFGVLRIHRDEFSKQQEVTRSMIGDQQKTIRKLEQKLDEYRVAMGGIVRNTAGGGVNGDVIAKYSVTLGPRGEQNAYTAELEAIALVLRCMPDGLRHRDVIIATRN